MKQNIKILIFTAFVWCSLSVQVHGQSDKAMQNIYEALSQKDCERALRNYEAWKVVSSSTDASIEHQIALCKNSKASAQNKFDEYLQSIEKALSEKNCEKAREVYRWYKDDGGAPDRELEARIANCGSSVYATSVQNTTVSTNNNVLARVRIEPGQRLTLIAEHYYGSKVFWVYIYEFNKDIIGPNPNRTITGMEILIPVAKLYGIDANDTNSIEKATELQRKIMEGP